MAEVRTLPCGCVEKTFLAYRVDNGRTGRACRDDLCSQEHTDADAERCKELQRRIVESN